MNLSETVVAYDATDFTSVKHIAWRNGRRDAACGDALQPGGRIRYIEGFDTQKDDAAATCWPCLIAWGRQQVERLHGCVSAELARAVNAEEKPEVKLELLLAAAMRGTAVTVDWLVAEHFPREVAERAESRAEIREV